MSLSPGAHPVRGRGAGQAAGGRQVPPRRPRPTTTRRALAEAFALDTVAAALAAARVGEVLVVTDDARVLRRAGRAGCARHPRRGLARPQRHPAPGRRRGRSPLARRWRRWRCAPTCPPCDPADLDAALDEVAAHLAAGGTSYVADAEGVGHHAVRRAARPFDPQFGPASAAVHRARGARARGGGRGDAAPRRRRPRRPAEALRHGVGARTAAPRRRARAGARTSCAVFLAGVFFAGATSSRCWPSCGAASSRRGLLRGRLRRLLGRAGARPVTPSSRRVVFFAVPSSPCGLRWRCFLAADFLAGRLLRGRGSSSSPRPWSATASRTSVAAGSRDPSAAARRPARGRAAAWRRRSMLRRSAPGVNLGTAVFAGLDPRRRCAGCGPSAPRGPASRTSRSP